ncbi:MAG: DNA polymerase III subunit gamma/tau [Methylococcales bacterium]|nr:DNA polymerase III subunit gamma/tau [Methylococcales bacterium]
MNYQVLARKWRPHNFTEVVGQDHVVKSLINALQHNRLHHAYLFTGTRGVGKTTIARILAKAINCENLQGSNPCGACEICLAVDEGRFLDLIEVDAASRTKVEDTRDLLDNAQYAPNQGRYKVYLIDEVHMLSGHSFNALLKTLEEPPPHVKFLLATTDPHKIPVTVLSRCLQFNLKRLLPTQIFEQMAFILQQEAIDFEAPALKLLSRAADGSMRDGLSLLDQAIVYGNGKVFAEDVRAMLGTVAQQPVEDLLSALSQGDAAAIFDIINEIANLTPDFGEVLQQMLQVLHRVALTQLIPSAVDHDFDVDLLAALSSQLSPEDVQLFYQIGLVGQKDLDLAPDPRSGFEMVMLRMLTFKPAAQPASPAAPIPAAKPLAAKPLSPAAVTAAPPSLALTNPTDSSDWLAMIVAMKLAGPTREFANNCVLEQLDDVSCTLAIDPDYIRGARAEESLQKALQAYRGTPVKLTVKAKKTTADTPAVQLTKEREDKQQAAVVAINEDPNIQALKGHFDARVMPGTIEPV